MVEVGRHYLGAAGAFAIVFGGLLATMSSANASVLSTSRAIYAVSKDALLPRRASHINLRYGTPHVALGMAGGPILVLVATGRVELLAEVASFLHLVMYGLICVALLVLRRNEPEWYDPDFRVPGYPVVPILGALTSFAPDRLHATRITTHRPRDHARNRRMVRLLRPRRDPEGVLQ